MHLSHVVLGSRACKGHLWSSTARENKGDGDKREGGQKDFGRDSAESVSRGNHAFVRVYGWPGRTSECPWQIQMKNRQLTGTIKSYMFVLCHHGLCV